MSKLIVEALVVGLITGIVGLIISTAFMLPSKDFSLNYHFWTQVLVSFFLTGFLIHLICEATGINKWYCKHGNACKL